MRHLKTEKWYAVVYMKINDSSDNDSEESSPADHQNIIAISKDSQTIDELTNILNKDYGYNVAVKTVDEILKNREFYNNHKLFATDTLMLTDNQVKTYEKQGRIIGNPKFKLNMPII